MSAGVGPGRPGESLSFFTMHIQRFLKRMVDRVVGRFGARARALVGRKRARDAEEAPCDTFFRFPRAPERSAVSRNKKKRFISTFGVPLVPTGREPSVMFVCTSCQFRGMCRFGACVSLCMPHTAPSRDASGYSVHGTLDRRRAHEEARVRLV